MENASKALILAAEVLIGILLISTAVYLFTSYSSVTNDIEYQMEESQIASFNSNFTSYETKEYITIYDVISIANLATQNNANYDFGNSNGYSLGKDYYIEVKFINKNIEGDADNDIDLDIETEINNNYINLLNTADGIQKYKVNVSISETTLRVYLVEISKF